MSHQNACGWKKAPRFFVAVDRLAAEWTQKADDRCGSGRAQQIGQQSASADIDERAVLRRQRLRITKAFFAPYLR
jgi:hypothetical protein